MTKLVLDKNSTNLSPSVFNENFRKIEEALNKDVLYRNNPPGEPNEMKSNLDMNGKRIYNLPPPSSDHEAARLIDVKNNTGPVGPSGPPGPPGPRGLPGKDGSGVTILDSYNTYADLIAAHPTGEVGEGYLVGEDLYIWAEGDNDWKNVGPIRGPVGPEGPPGPVAGDASEISFDPYLSVSANNVQGAIEQLEDEINSLGTAAHSNLTQVPGQSLSEVMSQKAVTDYVDSSFNKVGPYGVAWNQETDIYEVLGATDRTQIQVGMRRCVLFNDGTVNYFLDPFDSTKKEDGSPSDLTGTDGNVMVQIPKFYHKHILNGSRHEWWVSPTPESGFTVHPAFLRNGTTEVDFIYYRAYECQTIGGMLRSVSGVTPTRNKTRAVFRSEARANGARWSLPNWHIVNAIQLLYLTEYNTFNSQSVLGNGNDTGSDYGMTTGGSNIIGNASSGPLNNNTWMSYRGIENFYADCWEFIDGINVNNYQVYLSNEEDTYADGVYTGDYIDSGVSLPINVTDAYIRQVSGNFLPTTTGGGASSSTYITDAVWTATGERLVLLGGNAGAGFSCGFFCVLAYYDFSNSHAAIGAGLSFR